VTAGVADPADRPPRWIRAIGLVVLGVFVLFGIAGLEAWPLSGWKLFSTTREAVEKTWQAYAVDAAGDEVRVDWLELPTAVEPTAYQLREGERLCDGLVEVIGDETPDLTEVRVYLVDDELDADGERTELERELQYTCPAP